MEEQKKISIKKVPLLAMLVVLVVALAGGLYLYKNEEESAKNSLPSEWVEYKNEEYGIKFNYLADWGAPQIIVSTGDKGKSYTITFTEPLPRGTDSKKSKSLSIRVESKDYTKTVCSADEPKNCSTINALAPSVLKSRLENKTGLAAYDETSYSTIASQNGLNNTKILALTIAKIIDIKKMNADTLQLTYTMIGAPLLCTEVIEVDEDKNCFNRGQYSDLQNMLTSMKNI